MGNWKYLRETGGKKPEARIETNRSLFWLLASGFFP